MVRIFTKFAVFSLVIALSACCSTNYEAKTEPVPHMKVFFTPSTDCERNIIAEVNKAQQMDLAVYSISNPRIVDSLIDAQNRGAKIRIITDRTQAKGKGSLVGKLKSAGIPVVTNKKTKIEHNKFAVFDGKYVETGSYNYTNNASLHNSENCVFFDQLGEEYSRRFEYLWELYRNQ